MSDDMSSGAEPDASRPVPEPPPQRPSGPRTLATLLLGKPSTAQVVVAVLLAALGFAAVVQVRLIRADDNFGGARRDDLVVLLDSLSGATDRAQQQIDELRQTRNDLLTSSQRRQAAIAEERSRLGVLQILTGTVPTTGPGITVTIQDPHGAVTAPILLNGIDELRDAGAEAIEINDELRVVASTAFIDANGMIVADGIMLRAPYVIDAIGSSHTLGEAVMFPGGLSDEVEQVGGHVRATEAGVVDVQSLHTIVPPEYSQPTSR